MPIKCPACGYENLTGALLCAKCYELLVSLPSSDSKTLALSPVSDSSMKRSTDSLANEALTSTEPDTITLHFGQNRQPLVIRLKDQAILGREASRKTARYRIDLGPYGALEKGVSRMHILLRRTESGVVVEDMASSNGSWLNGVRLNPYVAVPIKSGDHVRLSKLEIEIRINLAAH